MENKGFKNRLFLHRCRFKDSKELSHDTRYDFTPTRMVV